MSTRFALIETGLAVAIVLTAAVAWRTPWAVAPLYVLAAIWPAADQAYEGPLLLHVTQYHGVVAADLLTPAAVLYGLVVLVVRARSRRRR